MSLPAQFADAPEVRVCVRGWDTSILGCILNYNEHWILVEEEWFQSSIGEDNDLHRRKVGVRKYVIPWGSITALQLNIKDKEEKKK